MVIGAPEIIIPFIDEICTCMDTSIRHIEISIPFILILYAPVPIPALEL